MTLTPDQLRAAAAWVECSPYGSWCDTDEELTQMADLIASLRAAADETTPPPTREEVEAVIDKIRSEFHQFTIEGIDITTSMATGRQVTHDLNEDIVAALIARGWVRIAAPATKGDANE